MTFVANVRTNEHLVVMELVGEIDGAADESLNAEYSKAIAGNPKTVLLAFDNVSYMNSTGIALIVGLLAEARRSGRDIVVCGLSDHYKEIFEITRINDFVTMYDDEQAAVAGVAT